MQAAISTRDKTKCAPHTRGDDPCGHNLFPCHADDKSVYTDEQLAEYEKESNALVEIDGRKMTKYEASQWQRSRERAIRKQKINAKIAQAGGDTKLAANRRNRAKFLTEQYKQV